ncbi:tRNA:m(4)X modification enzyme TRM13 homolog [Nematolebias whitei]|uniref:tRNA:m(4)X modification enzyme TRM13 homolog n=1 Tax=Nematolebias whitei TaxID=451745 RepID=UPI00189BBCA0|nr:tRNA:m(4)X modification enzyme TRM13 homolog [Nematolebias whitei]
MAAPGRCGFFVQKKNRFCKMVVGKGKQFCGEHATMEEVGGSKRIPCPLDPKHTVTKDKLEKHLKKCNSREKPRAVYFVKNINAGPSGGDENIPQVGLSERSRAELESLVDKLKTAVQGLQWDVEDKILSHLVLQDELTNPKNGDSAHKHLKQQTSILGHLEDLGLLRRGRCFVEFGAGRGKLSHWIHEALKTHEILKTHEDMKTQEDLQLLLVERSSTRFKVDGKHQDTRAEFERLQVDIQHLDLRKVPLLQQKKLPLVGVGKHLCGAATDLALRCLLETSKVREETEPAPKRLRSSEPSEPRSGEDPETPEPGSGIGPVLGLAVALCCHHRCEWRHYVGQRFFLQNGLGPAEFSAFCRMSSWATCGLRPANQDCPSQDPTNQRAELEGHEPADETDAVSWLSSAEERQQVGRLCKLLIDSGRLDFLKTEGFSGKLTRYVEPQVTLENMLLTAVTAEPGSDSCTLLFLCCVLMFDGKN